MRRKFISLRVPEEMYREFKTLCDEKGLKMTQVILTLMSDWIYLEKRRKKTLSE